MSSKYYDVIIIGGGIAGLTASIYATRAGKSTLVLEETICGGQIINAVSIDNWPGSLGISGTELILSTQKQAEELGATIEFEKVEKIKKQDDGFKIITEESEYETKNVIIAVGAEPRKLDAEQMKEVGERSISYCATCDGMLYKGKPVAVIGGGKTAESEVKYLETIASKVYQVRRGESIPEEAVAVFVAIGRVPSTGFLKGIVDLDEKGYIIAGEDCKTSCPGIFAVGDCRTKSVRQLVTAAADGAVAISLVV